MSPRPLTGARGRVPTHGRPVRLIWLAPAVLALAACARQPPADAVTGESSAAGPPAARPVRSAARDSAAAEYREPRRQMVERQLRGNGIRDARVLGAMLRVPRHRFVPPAAVPYAYEDRPLPIGFEQTISQPFIVAFMTEAAQVASHDTVLEIGTGSGYQAAVLGELVAAVYSIEIVPQLATRASETLAALGYDNVRVRAGDGYRGWAEHAPYDAIVVTAAPDHVPPALVEQLAPGGRLVIPVGTVEQEILVISKDARGITQRRTIPVRFVPFTGSLGRDTARPPPH